MQQLELVEARWEVKVNVWGKDNLIVVQSFYYQEFTWLFRSATITNPTLWAMNIGLQTLQSHYVELYSVKSNFFEETKVPNTKACIPLGGLPIRKL